MIVISIGRSCTSRLRMCYNKSCLHCSFFHSPPKPQPPTNLFLYYITVCYATYSYTLRLYNSVFYTLAVSVSFYIIEPRFISIFCCVNDKRCRNRTIHTPWWTTHTQRPKHSHNPRKQQYRTTTKTPDPHIKNTAQILCKFLDNGFDIQYCTLPILCMHSSFRSWNISNHIEQHIFHNTYSPFSFSLSLSQMKLPQDTQHTNRNTANTPNLFTLICIFLAIWIRKCFVFVVKKKPLVYGALKALPTNFSRRINRSIVFAGPDQIWFVWDKDYPLFHR